MRYLRHYGMLHDATVNPRIRTPQIELAERGYRFLLSSVFVPLAVNLGREHKQNPFHRIFFEGVYEIPQLEKGNLIAVIPAITLMEQGVSLQATEHRALDYLTSCFGIEEILANMEALKRIPKKVFIESLDIRIDPEGVAMIEEFLQDCDTVDISKARECWIGRRIAASLQEGDRALLFLGKMHKSQNIKRFLSPDTEYEYRDLFPGYLDTI